MVDRATMRNHSVQQKSRCLGNVVQLRSINEHSIIPTMDNKTQIDFTKFRLYTRIPRKEIRPFDVREELANSLYLAGRGIRMHDLAMRIFHSDGPVELDDADVQLLREFALTLSPAFIDSFDQNLCTETEAGK